MIEADVEALVNTVNCVGFMGKGIALQFKRAFPDNFTAYERACKADDVEPGKMCVYETRRLVNPKYIINFPTKRHWRGKSRIEDIESGLRALVSEVKRLGIQSIAVPPLGCGNGGLEWSTVKTDDPQCDGRVANGRCAPVCAARCTRSSKNASADETTEADSCPGSRTAVDEFVQGSWL